jgi:hypothetical protein
MNRDRPGLTGRWFAVALAALLLVGCPADEEDDTYERDAAIYYELINDIVKGSTVETEDPETLPTVYIEAFEPEGILLEVQVEIVVDFQERYNIRFVDDRIEATDIELPGSPVRPESLLLGMGPIVGDDDEVVVRGEQYFSEADIQAYRFTVGEQTDGSWSIVGSPAMVDPEGFRVTP